ncbi:MULTISPECIES: bifunctional riboflavin kinase/FAD synthetase [unclassified Synechocystis]|uniref:bifunctional riboflavin kinase/FAD synthetase n=1 Tax=unclassified Synechocystis TaxID=2640012 RepID=UPI0003FDF4EE|nr:MULTISPECIES: bifunctional riboflavin kinase/FAD synthetase [unclassified Synechocystis]AIE75374.1 Riboflavin kinase / FMN adenylyltransferase [Synechocystis sp. PCC 6714]MCT0253607.1 bifunctional riboflavin kinase/FAD synthetase [Synechocystis sp. CS-94]
MRILSATNALQTPTAIALGNFDGVHRGHGVVLRQVMNFAQAVEHPLHSAVVSFNPHPRSFFSGRTQPLLTPLPEKAEQLTVIGIEQLVLLPFTEKLANLSPREFVQSILVEQLQAKFISVGEDFCFGYQRQGNVQDLARLGQEFGITVAIAELEQTDTERISSSRIRKALKEGQLATANNLLGRPYGLRGTVVQGQQLGRKLGFPTANLCLPEDKLWPKYGVYAGSVSLDCLEVPIPAVINIGDRPTVNGREPSAEVHLLQWSGDLYGQGLEAALLHYLRPETKFANLDELKNQISRDCQRAEELLHLEKVISL